MFVFMYMYMPILYTQGPLGLMQIKHIISLVKGWLEIDMGEVIGLKS